MDNTIISRRERKKIKSQEMIVDAALHLFRSKGYEHTSIEDVTEMADVSKGTFYNYFPNKESLLFGISERSVNELKSYIKNELHDEKDPAIKLRLALERMVKDAIPYIQITQRIISGNALSADPSSTSTPQVIKIIENLVKEAQKCGKIRDDLSAKEIATSLTGILDVVVYSWSDAQSLSPEKLNSRLQGLFKVFFEGVAGSQYKTN